MPDVFDRDTGFSLNPFKRLRVYFFSKHPKCRLTRDHAFFRIDHDLSQKIDLVVAIKPLPFRSVIAQQGPLFLLASEQYVWITINSDVRLAKERACISTHQKPAIGPLSHELMIVAALFNQDFCNALSQRLIGPRFHAQPTIYPLGKDRRPGVDNNHLRPLFSPLLNFD